MKVDQTPEFNMKKCYINQWLVPDDQSNAMDNMVVIQIDKDQTKGLNKGAELMTFIVYQK